MQRKGNILKTGISVSQYNEKCALLCSDGYKMRDEFRRVKNGSGKIYQLYFREVDQNTVIGLVTMVWGKPLFAQFFSPSILGKKNPEFNLLGGTREK